MKGAVRIVYPAQCPGCAAVVDRDGALCPDCWSRSEFITGVCCVRCAVPLPGQTGEGLECDDCAAVPPPWREGAAAMVYDGPGRDMVLALKHGERLDLAPTLGFWLARAAVRMIAADTLIVPIPVHPRRLLRRKYNQALLLSSHVARLTGAVHAPAALRRVRHTPAQDHRSAEERRENLRDALRVSDAGQINGRHVVLIDDVMASGATMTTATGALLKAGAAWVDVAVFARAVKDL
ncbi:MAG: amidophosphoribosyltransferase [Paracoccus denitrificans]|nr:MAG: amidophosphoribosyltransferase [Paracoccus denitrificans]PZO85153.1 MAG: amidophosphoribosyltransferase [Paracoccus denitrificans]